MSRVGTPEISLHTGKHIRYGATLVDLRGALRYIDSAPRQNATASDLRTILQKEGGVRLPGNLLGFDSIDRWELIDLGSNSLPIILLGNSPIARTALREYPATVLINRGITDGTVYAEEIKLAGIAEDSTGIKRVATVHFRGGKIANLSSRTAGELIEFNVSTSTAEMQTNWEDITLDPNYPYERAGIITKAMVKAVGQIGAVLLLCSKLTPENPTAVIDDIHRVPNQPSRSNKPKDCGFSIVVLENTYTLKSPNWEISFPRRLATR